jgi:hypothetical protein
MFADAAAAAFSAPTDPEVLQRPSVFPFDNETAQDRAQAENLVPGGQGSGSQTHFLACSGGNRQTPCLERVGRISYIFFKR